MRNREAGDQVREQKCTVGQIIIVSDFLHHNKSKTGLRSQGTKHLQVLQAVWKWLIVVLKLDKDTNEAMKGMMV